MNSHRDAEKSDEQYLRLYGEMLKRQKYLLKKEDLEPIFCFKKPKVKQEAAFHVSRWYSCAMVDVSDWNKLDRMGDTPLFLRMIPCSSPTTVSNNCKELKAAVQEKAGKPLGLIVSVVEFFELAQAISIKPSDWAKQGVGHYLLPIPDFTAEVSVESLFAAASVIKEYVGTNASSIVVHCKAGRSRSAMLVACYLLMEKNKEELATKANAVIEDILASLCGWRAQVSISEEKRNKLKDFCQYLIKKEPQVPEEHVLDLNNPMPVFEGFLSSLKLKNGLSQSLALKMMAIYHAEKPGSCRAQHLANFSKAIWDARNHNWYGEYLLGRGELHNFINADKWFRNDIADRLRIKETFDKELDVLMMTTFGCDPDQLEQYKAQFKEKYTKEGPLKEDGSRKGVGVESYSPRPGR